MADRNVNVRLSAQVGQYVAAMQTASAATKNVTTAGVDLQKLGGQFQRFGQVATLGLTAPIAAAGVAAVGMSNKFNSSFTRMTTLAGMTTSEIGGMRDAVLELSKQTGRGPQELADALYAASSSGLDARQSLDAVTIAAKGAASGLGSTEDIISLVASATASYGEANMDAAKATDILVGTIREGRADPDELAGSLGRILPVASNLGVSFEEVGGSVAFLSNVFGDTNRTVTAMSGVLNKLQSPTDAARDALAKYGTSMEELHRIIDEDGLLGAMRHLQEIGLGDDPLAFRAVFDDVEARQGAQAMIDNLEAMEGAIDGVESSSGALAEAWNATQGEEGFKMAQAWAEIQVALVEFGDAIGPIAADVASAVANIASAFAALPEGVQVAVAAALVALGPMAFIAGTIMKHAETIAAARALMMGGAAGGAAGAGRLPLIVPGLATTAVLGGADFMLRGPDSFGADLLRMLGLNDAEIAAVNPIPSRNHGGLSLLDQLGIVRQGLTRDVNSSLAWSATRDAGWSTAGAASPFFSSGPLLTPTGVSVNMTPPSDAQRQDAWSQLGEVFAAGGGLAGPTGSSADNLSTMRGQYEALTAAAAEYALVTASTDWGAAGFTAAATAMSRYTSEFFGLANIAMATEEAYDRLDDSLEKNGMTFDLTTEKGRANQQALQALAGTLDSQFVAAYDAADGSMSKFMASADEIGLQTIARLSDELGISTEAAVELATQMGLTATDYEARFNLAGDAEAKLKLDLLSGSIELLQEDVRREVAMKIATGDFQGALDTVQANIAETPETYTTTFNAVDNVSGPVYSMQRTINSLTGKTVTIGVRRQGGSNPGLTYDFGGGDVATADGGYFGGPDIRLIGEAGAEVVLPLTRPNRLRELLADPRVLTPIGAALGGGGGGGAGVAGGGGINIVVNAGMGTDGYHVGQQIVNVLARYTRVNGPGGLQRAMAV